MDKKLITFLISSNRKGATRSLVVSAGVLKIVGVGAVIGMIFVSSIMIDYVGLLAQTLENKRLKTENLILHEQFKVVEGKLNALEQSLERVKISSNKLKLITNIDDPNRELNLALGPGSRTGHDMDQLTVALDERGPASEFGAEDEIFFEDRPVNTTRGELSVGGQTDYGSLAVRIDLAVKETQLREQSVLELWDFLDERESLLSATPSIKPVKGWFTSRFGYRLSPWTGRPVMHNGIDIAASPGTPIFAPADGVVSFAGYDAGYGKLVSIDHGYGVVTRFGHNSQIFVKVGQKVTRRDIIAGVGTTGRSTGPHLHYEVRVNNVPVDPMNYILVE